MIAGEVRRYLRDNSTIRVSRSIRDIAYRVLQCKESMTARLDREPTLEEISKELDIPMEEVSYEQLPSDTPDWLKPYLAAALRSGLTAGLPKSETGSFEAALPITGAEAAVMLQNALDLSISQETLEVMQTDAPAKGGCGATLTAGVAVILLAAAAAVIRKKD